MVFRHPIISVLMLSALVSCTSDGPVGAPDVGTSPGTPAPPLADAGSSSTPDVGSQDTCLDPGFVPLRRVSRRAFGQVLHDLLGADPQTAKNLPEDDIGHGFDHLGEVLSFTPVHLEQAEAITEIAVADALRVAPPAERAIYPAEELTASVGGPHRSGGWNLWSRGELELFFSAPAGGTYEISVYGYGQQAGPDPARMTLWVDNAEVHTFDVTAEGAPAAHVHRVAVEPGERRIAVEFINDFYNPEAPDPSQRDRNLIIDRIEINGPFELELDNPIREGLIDCDTSLGASCVMPALRRFAERAWRQQIGETDWARYSELINQTVAAGAAWEEALHVGLKTIVLSPRLLYLLEPSVGPEPARLNGYELATRLAFFLWDAPPDPALLEAARLGQLDQSEGFETQVDRMLASPKAQQLLESFFAQWLHLSNLETVQPDYHYFPTFDEPLRRAMRQETDLVLSWLFNGDQSLSDLFSSAPTYVNDRLKAHYGLEAQGQALEGHDGWFEVDGQAAGRGGLLTHGSILTLTSFPTRTSPVKRGKWVLERLLCDAPPPPPPGVEDNLDDPELGGTFRERLAQHRADPACAACHQSMDPIGLGMDGYDGVGARRAEAIDTTGALPDGRSFDGLAELQEIIADDPRLSECFVEQMVIYALARAPRTLDRCHKEAILDEFRASGQGVKTLFKTITSSRLFIESRARQEGER